jgi:hypothetical protein
MVGALYMTLPPSPTSEIEQPAPSTSKTVLDPSGFSGKVMQAYQIAKDNPRLLQQFDCYCGCENPMHSPYHTSLFECFTDTHGANCQVCIEEALLVFQMSQDGATIGEIRQEILSKFG